MQAIILCGGLATRLDKIAEKIPKILLPIDHRTVLDLQIDFLKKVGVNEVILASGHLHDILSDRIGSSYRSVKIRYAREQKKLGTGGAIKNAMNFIDRSPFFVLNGDVLIDFSAVKIYDRFESKKMIGMLVAVHIDDLRPYGEIEFDHDHRIINFREKDQKLRSGYASGGVYLFDASIADYFPKSDQFSIERDVFPKVKNLYAFPIRADWIDVGVPDRLAFARQLTWN